MSRYELLAPVGLVLLARPAAAGAAPDRDDRVVLLDFSHPPALPRTLRPEPAPGEAMMQDFATMDWANAPAAPAAAGSWSNSSDRGRPSARDSCSSRSYEPSALLKPAAEERRRLYYPLVQHAACAEGVSVALVDALLIQESGYNPAALSPKGAFGLGQLMPETARQLGIDRFDTGANVRGAARYLQQLIAEFGAIHLALAAYNAGPERVRAAGGLPPIRETLTYVRRVLQNWSVLQRR